MPFLKIFPFISFILYLLALSKFNISIYDAIIFSTCSLSLFNDNKLHISNIFSNEELNPHHSCGFNLHIIIFLFILSKSNILFKYFETFLNNSYI